MVFSKFSAEQQGTCISITGVEGKADYNKIMEVLTSFSVQINRSIPLLE
jgi:hypothetical protein